MSNYPDLYELMAQLIDISNREEDEWMDSVMERTLPPKLYEAAHSGDERKIRLVRDYLARNNIRKVVCPGRNFTIVELRRGDEILGEFVRP